MDRAARGGMRPARARVSALRARESARCARGCAAACTQADRGPRAAEARARAGGRLRRATIRGGRPSADLRHGRSTTQDRPAGSARTDGERASSISPWRGRAEAHGPGEAGRPGVAERRLGRTWGALDELPGATRRRYVRREPETRASRCGTSRRGHAHVLADNQPRLRFVQRLGFRSTGSDDPFVVLERALPQLRTSWRTAPRSE
jgi:hypothetical protein